MKDYKIDDVNEFIDDHIFDNDLSLEIFEDAKNHRLLLSADKYGNLVETVTCILDDVACVFNFYNKSQNNFYTIR